MNLVIRPMKAGNRILPNFFEVEIQNPCCQTMEHFVERRRHDDILRTMTYSSMRGYACRHCNRRIDISLHPDYRNRT